MDHTAPYGTIDPRAERSRARAARLGSGVGLAVSATGLLHLALGVDAFSGPLLAIVRDGLVDTISADVERDNAWWFLVAGGFLVVTGLTIRWAVRTADQLPAVLGWGMIVISVLGVVLAPASGFWLVLVEGGLLVHASRRLARPARPAPYSPDPADPTTAPGVDRAQRH